MSSQGYPSLASSVNIAYLNRVKRDLFNILGGGGEGKGNQKAEKRKRKVLISLDACCWKQTVAYSLLALPRHLAPRHPACTQQLKSSSWTLNPAKHGYAQQHERTWTYRSGLPRAPLWCVGLHGLGEKQICGKLGNWKKTHPTSPSIPQWLINLATAVAWHWSLLSFWVQLGPWAALTLPPRL